MPWVKLSDDYTDSLELAAVDPVLRACAVELSIAALCYCGRLLTDGHVPRSQIGRLVDFSPNGIDAHAVAAELVRVGLWEETPGGYAIHDYLKDQPSRAKVESDRAEWRRRQAKSRKRSRKVSRRASQRESTSPVPVPEPLTGHEELSSPKASRLSAPRETDWDERADQILAATQFRPEHERLAELLAEAIKTGTVAVRRVVRELYEPLAKLEAETDPAALRYGLEAAIAAGAPNARYVAKAAAGYRANGKGLAPTSRLGGLDDYDCDFLTEG